MVTKLSSSPVRRSRSCWSMTPFSNRRKKLDMPCSRILPRGLSSAAPGAIALPNGSSVFSFPPAPCRSSSAGAAGFEACSKRCSNPESSFLSRRYAPLIGLFSLTALSFRAARPKLRQLGSRAFRNGRRAAATRQDCRHRERHPENRHRRHRRLRWCRSPLPKAPM